MTHRLNRRTFLKATAGSAAVLGFPLPLRAQPKTFKIGAIHPVTGALAEPGQACRLGAQMAVDAINAAGGIKSKGGIRLELIVGDTQTKPENGRVEAERVVSQGAQMLLGSFDSGSTNAMVSVAQQRRVPFLIDIAAADPITRERRRVGQERSAEGPVRLPQLPHRLELRPQGRPVLHRHLQGSQCRRPSGSS